MKGCMHKLTRRTLIRRPAIPQNMASEDGKGFT
jgi:hypothetical protein